VIEIALSLFLAAFRFAEFWFGSVCLTNSLRFDSACTTLDPTNAALVLERFLVTSKGSSNGLCWWFLARSWYGSMCSTNSLRLDTACTTLDPTEDALALGMFWVRSSCSSNGLCWWWSAQFWFGSMFSTNTLRLDSACTTVELTAAALALWMIRVSGSWWWHNDDSVLKVVVLGDQILQVCVSVCRSPPRQFRFSTVPVSKT